MAIKDEFEAFQLSGFVEVQRAQKVVPYTISLIGDATALKEYRMQAIAKEMAWQAAQKPLRQQRRANAIAAVQAQDGRRSEAVKAIEKAQLEENQLRKLAIAKKPKAVAAPMNEVYVPQPEPTVIQKAFKWLKSLVS